MFLSIKWWIKMKNVQSLIEVEKMQTETTAMFPPIKLEKKLVFIFRAIKGTEKYSCRNKLTFLREIWHKIVNINTFQRLSREGSILASQCMVALQCVACILYTIPMAPTVTSFNSGKLRHLFWSQFLEGKFFRDLQYLNSVITLLKTELYVILELKQWMRLWGVF